MLHQTDIVLDLREELIDLLRAVTELDLFKFLLLNIFCSDHSGCFSFPILPRTGTSLHNYAVCFELVDKILADEADVIGRNDIGQVCNGLEAAAVCIRYADKEVDDAALILG